MNKYINIFICFITGIIIYLLIENTFKVNSIEGFDLLSILGITKEEEVTLLQLLQTNLQLDELINLFKSNRADCIGEFRPTECDKKCGFGVRDSIYTITQQKGDKGMPCPYKDGHIKQERCINKTCGDDKLCFKNEDCKSLNCDKVTMKCQSLFDCDRGDFIDKPSAYNLSNP